MKKRIKEAAMKEYLKKFFIFIVLCIVAAAIFRMAIPKTMNVRVVDSVDTQTKVKF